MNPHQVFLNVSVAGRWPPANNLLRSLATARARTFARAPPPLTAAAAPPLTLEAGSVFFFFPQPSPPSAAVLSQLTLSDAIGRRSALHMENAGKRTNGKTRRRRRNAAPHICLPHQQSGAASSSCHRCFPKAAAAAVARSSPQLCEIAPSIPAGTPPTPPLLPSAPLLTPTVKIFSNSFVLLVQQNNSVSLHLFSCGGDESIHTSGSQRRQQQQQQRDVRACTHTQKHTEKQTFLLQCVEVKKKSCALCRGSLTFHGSQTIDGRTSFRPLALTLTPPPRIPASLRKAACVQQQQQLGVCVGVCVRLHGRTCVGVDGEVGLPLQDAVDDPGAVPVRGVVGVARRHLQHRRACERNTVTHTMTLGQAVFSIQPRKQSESLITSVNTIGG